MWLFNPPTNQGFLVCRYLFTRASSIIKCKWAYSYSFGWILFPIVLWDSFRWALIPLDLISFQPSQIQAEHKEAVQCALTIPSKKIWGGILASKQECLEHCHPSKRDDLTKFSLINEKELGSKVMEIRETLDKSTQCNVINLFGTDSIKKGILGVIPILFFSTRSFY